MSRSAEFHFGAAHMQRLGTYARETGFSHLAYAQASQDVGEGRISEDRMQEAVGQIGAYIHTIRQMNEPAGKTQTFVGKETPRGTQKNGRRALRDWN